MKYLDYFLKLLFKVIVIVFLLSFVLVALAYIL